MRIRTRGFKGMDHDLELGRLNLVEGPNGAGKSAMADAVRFLALGYVPHLGKRHQDAGVLMAGDLMQVELELGNGRTAARRLFRDGKSLKMEAECSWLKNAKPTEHDKAITALFGKEAADAAETLDIRILLGATPAQRARRIEELISSTGGDPERLAERTAALTASRLTGIDLEGIEDWKDLLRTLKKGQREILKDEVSGPLQARIGEDGMAGACKWANDRKRDADQGLRTKKAALKEIEARIKDIPDLAGQLERCGQDRDRLQREMGAAKERLEAHEKEEKKRSGLTRLADFLKADCSDIVKRLDEMKVAGSLSEKEVEGTRLLIAKDREKADDHARICKDAMEKVDRLRNAVPELPDCHEQERALRDVEAHLSSAEADGWPRVFEIAVRLMAYSSAKIQKLGRELHDITDEKVKASLEELRSKVTAADKAFADAKADLAVIVKKREGAHKKIDETESRAAIHREKADQFLKGAEKKSRKLDESLAGATERTKLQATLEAKRDELKRVEKDSEGPWMGQLDPMERVKIQEKLDEIDRRLETLRGAAAGREELERIKREIEQEAARSDVMRAVEWACLRVREEEVTAAGGPLVAGIRSFLDQAEIKAEPFFRASRGACEIGWVRDSKEVDVRALSGGEWILFTAALVTTILEIRKPELSILLVEAGETDNSRLDSLLMAIEQSKGLDLVLVMTPPRVGDGWDEWERVLLGEVQSVKK